MHNAQSQLFCTNNQSTAKLISKHNHSHNIFTVILTIILSLALTLSLTTKTCFAATLTNTSSTHTLFFSNHKVVVATAVGALGLGAILVGLLNNNSNNSNSNNTPASSDKAITAFSFTSPAAIGTIDEAAKTIAITVPYGTDVTKLTATFTTTGARVKVGHTTQTSGSTTNDFTNPVKYTVIAADDTTAVYTVTVAIAPPTTFTVTYNKNAPNGSAISGTLPIDARPYTSGDTVIVLGNKFSIGENDNLIEKDHNYVFNGWKTAPNDAGTIYQPGAEFSISQNTTLYAIWTPVSDIPDVKKSFGGGIVIVKDTTNHKVLIMATSDQSSGSKWDSSLSYDTTSAFDGCFNNMGGISDCTKDGYEINQIGSGNAVDGNTFNIINTIHDNAAAAKACTSYTGGGYTDWYLPSIWELGQMSIKSDVYWSSTELVDFSLGAWFQNFGVGYQGVDVKNFDYGVRAVRAFSY